MRLLPFQKFEIEDIHKPVFNLEKLAEMDDISPIIKNLNKEDFSNLLRLR